MKIVLVILLVLVLGVAAAIPWLPHRPLSDAWHALNNEQGATASELVGLWLQQWRAEAKYRLGQHYARPEAADWTEAQHWLHAAAEQGHAGAQRAMGELYDHGRAVPESFAEAARWYQMAAEQGNTQAQWTLGERYAEGKGLAQNAGEAEKWFRTAAEQGDVQAQFRLAEMYAGGRIVQVNLVQAHRWYNLAASRATGELQQKAVAGRTAVSQKMTPAEISEAQNQATQWQVQSPEQH